MTAPSEHRSHHTLSESSTSSSTSSRVSSPSIVAMSDFSNIATSTTASSSTTSLVIPSDSSSADGLSFNSPYTPTNDAQSINGDSCNATASQDSLEPEVDPQILEALRSKDRIYVLRLGEIMEELITEKKYAHCLHTRLILRPFVDLARTSPQPHPISVCSCIVVLPIIGSK